MKKHNPNTVLLFKQQGEMPSSDCQTLQENDFLHVLQMPLQAEVLKKIGPDRIICIDDTHGTNSYDFHLTTVLIVDEFGEGYPTAWCLSNRIDCGTLIYFFRAIKKNLGLNIVPKWIMTDDAGQFYTAWVSVFGEGLGLSNLVPCVSNLVYLEKQGVQGAYAQVLLSSSYLEPSQQ